MFYTIILGKLSRILLYESHLPRTISSQLFNDRNLLYRQLKKNVFLPSRCKGMKSHLDFSKVPTLDENDLEEQFVRGSGPGGQATAKTNNAVVLKHKPTGIVVKCHETRSQWDNKKRAREILITRLDNMINGENSIVNQERLFLAKKSATLRRKKEKMLALKAAFKEREGLK